MNPNQYNWSPYAIGGATRPDSFTSMNPDMQSGLYAMLQAAEADLGPGLQVYSGYRSPELQAKLFEDAVAKYGSEAAARKWVAPPGKSQHNTGNAADLKFNGVRLDQSPEAAAWVKSNAANFGLAVPMEWEPWQVELAGARGQPAPAAPAAQSNPYQIPAEHEQPEGLMGALEAYAASDAAQQFMGNGGFSAMVPPPPQIAPMQATAIAPSQYSGLANYRDFFGSF